MPYTDVDTLRLSAVPRKLFKEIVGTLAAAVGRPDMGEFRSAELHQTRRPDRPMNHLLKVGKAAYGSKEALAVARDLGAKIGRLLEAAAR